MTTPFASSSAIGLAFANPMLLTAIAAARIVPHIVLICTAFLSHLFLLGEKTGGIRRDIDLASVGRYAYVPVEVRRIRLDSHAIVDVDSIS